MPINISVPESDLPDIIAFYASKQTILDDNVIKAQAAANNNAELLKTLQSLVPVSLIDGLFNAPLVEYPNGYYATMIWVDKVKYILRKSNNGMSTKEIIDELLKIEPKYKQDRQSAVRSISATLSAKSKREGDVFKKRKNERNEFIYSINEGTDEKAEAKQLEITADEVK